MNLIKFSSQNKQQMHTLKPHDAHSEPAFLCSLSLQNIGIMHFPQQTHPQQNAYHSEKTSEIKVTL
jgi:hypothetical protein